MTEHWTPGSCFQKRRSPPAGRTDCAHGSFLVFLALLPIGCVSMAPRFITPPLPVAPRYATGLQGDGTVASLSWRGYFTDPRLAALITQSLDHNQDLRIAVLRVEEARAIYGVQRADQFPALTAQAGLNRSRTPIDLTYPGFPAVTSQYQVALGLGSWEMDFWGRVRSLKDAALESYLATDAARQAATLGLITEVANTYLGLLELDERVRLARLALASRVESLRIFTRRVEVGSTSRLDLTQVQTLLTQAQALTAQLEQSREAQFQALTLLVGTPVDLPFPAGTARLARPNAPGPESGMAAAQSAQSCLMDETFKLVELQPGLPSDLLVQRPDIIAAEHQLKAAHANIGVARAAFFPRIALTGSFGTASAEFDGLFKSGSRAWTFSPSITLPIFEGGRLRNNLSLVEVRRDLAVATYEKTIQTAFREVSDALSARLWLTEQVAIAGSAVKVQTERARLSQLRYDNGASAYLAVLDAQRDLLSAEQQFVQTRRALLSSRVRLYATLGGGTVDHASMPSHRSLAPNRKTSPP